MEGRGEWGAGDGWEVEGGLYHILNKTIVSSVKCRNT